MHERVLVNCFHNIVIKEAHQDTLTGGNLRANARRLFFFLEMIELEVKNRSVDATSPTPFIKPHEYAPILPSMNTLKEWSKKEKILCMLNGRSKGKEIQQA